MNIEYMIVYPSGARASGIMDMQNTESKRKFAALAEKSLRNGATVTTYRVPTDTVPTRQLKKEVAERAGRLFGG
jgi:hypothetical protein